MAQERQAASLTWALFETASIRPRVAHGMVRSQAAAATINRMIRVNRTGSPSQ